MTAIASKNIQNVSTKTSSVNATNGALDLCWLYLLRLTDGAGKAIEDEAVGALGGLDCLLDDAHHDVIGHEAARVHHLLGLLAHVGARRDSRAQLTEGSSSAKRNTASRWRSSLTCQITYKSTQSQIPYHQSPSGRGSSSP